MTALSTMTPSRWGSALQLVGVDADQLRRRGRRQFAAEQAARLLERRARRRDARRDLAAEMIERLRDQRQRRKSDQRSGHGRGAAAAVRPGTPAAARGRSGRRANRTGRAAATARGAVARALHQRGDAVEDRAAFAAAHRAARAASCAGCTRKAVAHTGTARDEAHRRVPRRSAQPSRPSRASCRSHGA